MGSTKGHELGQLFEINNLSTDHFTKKKKNTGDKENLQKELGLLVRIKQICVRYY